MVHLPASLFEPEEIPFARLEQPTPKPRRTKLQRIRDERMIIAVDTREQRPYRFPVSTSVLTLTTGDYSILGLENHIAVERKQRDELWSNLGSDRPRFRREFERLAQLQSAHLVVEATLRDLITPPRWCQMSSKTVINTLASWSQKFHVCCWFAGDRTMAQALTFRILEKYFFATLLEESSDEEQPIEFVTQVYCDGNHKKGLRQHIDAGGHTMYELICKDCGIHLGDKKWISHAESAGFLVVKRTSEDQHVCEHCGVIGAEAHHIAPRHLFNDADDWPIIWLCQRCHSLWHSVVTPSMSKKRNNK